MIRDCLFHLSFSDIDDFFLNLSKTNYKFLVTTTHILSDTYVNMMSLVVILGILTYLNHLLTFKKRILLNAVMITFLDLHQRNDIDC